MESRRGSLSALTALVLGTVMAMSILARNPGRAEAAGGLTILQSDATNQFPTRLVFHVVAQGPAQISSVRLAYRVNDDAVTTVAALQFSPGNRVDASYPLNLTRDYLPPGVTVHYQWLVQDDSNAQVASTWNDQLLSDPRFLWHSRTNGSVTLHWYDGDDQFADQLLSTGSQAATAAAQSAGVSPVPVNVWLYGNPNDFRSALGAGSEQWVGGETFPAYHEVILLAPTNDVANDQRSVAHEMTHVAVDDPSADVFGQLPQWLDEGLAMVAEGPTDPTYQQVLSQAASAGKLMSVQSISGNFPPDSAGASLAYAESDSLVRYLTRTYGQAKVERLVAAFRQGSSSDEAFQAAFGASVGQIQAAWEKSLGSPAGRPAAATPTGPTAAPSGGGLLRGLGDAIQGLLRLLTQPKQAQAGA